jgi:hypothetical protein
MKIILLLIALSLTVQDKARMLNAAHRVVPRVRLKIAVVRGDYARVELPDAARIYLHRNANGWKVIAGPGTGWSPQELDRLHLPRAVR